MAKYRGKATRDLVDVLKVGCGRIPDWFHKLVVDNKAEIGYDGVLILKKNNQWTPVFNGDYVVRYPNGNLDSVSEGQLSYMYDPIPEEVIPIPCMGENAVSRKLRYTEKKYENARTYTGQVCIHDMAKDAADEIDRLEKELVELRAKKDPSVEVNYLSIQLREMAHGGQFLLGTKAIATLDNAVYALEALQGANTLLGGCVRDAVHEKHELKKTLRELGKE